MEAAIEPRTSKLPPANSDSSAAPRPREPIAIIGIGCVLPGGADSPEAFWSLLSEARDAIVAVPADRWNIAAHFDPDPAIPGKTVARRGGFIDGISKFDAAFFGISPREAALMDPQHRLLLRCAWEALEDAGLPLDRVARSNTGVFVGISHSDYHGIQKFGRSTIDVHTATGSALSIAANRISHRFDLRGPSFAVDTACSSALVAVDAACESLWTGRCEMALAGGVNAILTPDVTISFSRASMLSPDGRCKAFDARANGYVRGEGAGIVALKPLARALADGDPIHAVIRATVVNQDGRTSTITVPSRDAQEVMLREACARAGIAPSAVGYVEAHGTGTAVGDPIEAAAIGSVFGGGRAAPCLLGSCKTNIGHLESAAGIAGLIKAVLCVRNGAIPPNLHFETPNPNIPFAELNIDVPRRLTPFPAGERLVAVNSFGFGGTNACAIVGAAPSARAAQAAADAPVLIPLTAASDAGLNRVAARLAPVLDDPAVTLADLAATLGARRTHLDHRLAVVGATRADLAADLAAIARGERPARAVAGRRENRNGPVFVFTGQGAQWWAMGRGLLASDKVFRATIERCDAIFRAIAGWSVLDEMMADEVRSRMNETAVAQPATFALQVALAARWREWGIVPAAVVGHSIGEIAAAHVCGALSLEDAARVVLHRSRLQERTRGQGAMAAIGVPVEQAPALLRGFEDRLEVAAVNGPLSITIAGERAALEVLLGQIDERAPGVLRQLLKVDYAFHSRQMDPFKDEMLASLDGLRSVAPSVPMISTVTGRPVEAGALDADYWWRNMREPVVFRDAVDCLIAAGHRGFLELGPHPALAAPTMACLEERGHTGFAVGSLRRHEPDGDTMLKALGALWTRGIAVDWRAVAPGGRADLRLPRYPWDEHVFWADSEEARAARFDAPDHPLLGTRLHAARPIWQVEIGQQFQPFLKDHSIDGAVVFPAAGYVEIVLAAARALFGDVACEAEDVAFHEALFLAEGRSVLLQTVHEPARGTVAIFSRLRDVETDWTLRASARIRACNASPPAADAWSEAAVPPERVGGRRFYEQLRREGHDFGPAFRGVDLLWHSEKEVLGSIAVPDALAGAAGFALHPAVLDSCFQVVRGFRGFADQDAGDVAMPVKIAQVRLFGRAHGRLFSRGQRVALDDAKLVADLHVFDEGGACVATVRGFACRRLRRAAADTTAAASAAHYLTRWVRRDLPADAAGDSLGGRWLVFADRGRIGDELAARIAAAGGSATVLRAGARFRQGSAGRFTVRAGAPDDLTRALGAAGLALTDLTGIAHLWSLDAAAPERLDGDFLWAAQSEGSLHVLKLVQALGAADAAPRLWIATAGAQLVEHGSNGTTPDLSLAAAPVAGLARTIANEYPQLRCTTIDLDAAAPEAAPLLAEIVAGESEPEIAYRHDQRFVGRIERVAIDDIAPRAMATGAGEDVPPFRLTMSSPGVIDHLMLQEMALPRPAAGEVIVKVRAVGLNFRDVMAATGLLPAEAEDNAAWQHLGFECAGAVTAVGEGVTTHAVGDAVIAIARGSFASHVAVPAALVFAKPARLGDAEAAALPTAFLTAHHALTTLARVGAGERVLIHAGTGGVGLAAIQIARRAGAEIFATAGSPEKRDYLRALGVRHVMDSRSLDFADAVIAATGGRGVDVVLNALPGAFIDKGLSVLAPFGRFVEIGKRDIYADTPIGLAALRQNIAFMVVDLARAAEQRPQILVEGMARVAGLIEAGELKPLPVERFPLSRVVEAFRQMAAAKHIGKVVVTFDGEPARIVRHADRPAAFRADGTYLVTGGLGGFGLATARWLVENGARHVVLASRSGVAAPGALDEMRARGATVTPVAADVTRRGDVDAVLAAIAASGVALRGIFHAAMVLDDDFIAKLDDERMRRVMAPKLLGAWNLHAASRGLPLDHFVLYSSIASVVGSNGQANYVAGNRFLDALAEYRRQRGLPALAVNWGALAGTGHLVKREDVARYLNAAGIASIPADDALAALGRLLQRDAATVAYAGIDWQRLARVNPALGDSPRCRHLGDGARSEEGGGSVRAELLAAAPERRGGMLADYLRRQVASVLKTAPAAVEPTRPLSEFGLDSLTSFELKNRIETQLGLTIPIGKFLQRPSVATLAEAFLERLEADDGSEAAPLAAAEPAAGALALSYGQEALAFLHALDPSSASYHLVYCVGVRPRLDVESLARAFAQVVARHPSLRASFPLENGVPIQATRPADEFRLAVHDTADMAEEEFRRLLAGRANAPFDLAGEPLIRLDLYHRAGERDVLLLSLHHIIADAWSLSIALEEMFAIYMASRYGGTAALPATAHGYADYVRWQRAFVAGPDGERQFAYWREQLRALPPPLELPVDRARAPTQSAKGGACNFSLGAELVASLKRVALAENATFFTVLLASYKALLYRLTGQDDLLVGVPVAVRTRAEFERTVGYFVNPVVVRSRIAADFTFRDLLREATGSVKAALENQDYPFALLVQKLHADRYEDRSPLFQVGFAMERAAGIDSRGFAVTLLNTGGPSLQLRDYQLDSVPLERDRSQFDLTLVVEEFDDRVYGVVDYRADLFDPATVERMIKQYETILAAVAANPDTPLDEIALSAPGRIGAVPHDALRYDGADVVTMFEAQASARPDAIAVECGGDRLSYRALGARVDALAGALAARGIGRGALVGIALGRGIDLPLAMLAVAKAGAAYVPLDPAYPAERLAHMIESADPAAVLVHAATRAQIPAADDRVLVLDDPSWRRDAPAAACARDLDDLAYVIHTSGSTGRPVGVEITHRALANFLRAMAVEPGMTDRSAILAVTTLSFDIAVLELLLPLTVGARSVIADDAMVRDGRLLAGRLARGDITKMQATPATWRMVVDAGWTGGARFTALCGGERMPRDLADALLARAGSVWNLYGPTETTVWSTAMRVGPGSGPVPIGHPIANTTCVVLDAAMRAVPDGVAGELFIGGAGLARGYRGRPDLTNARFVADPHHPDARLFRTGDIVRRRADGSLAYVGRRDSQIKLRGFRIELGDIEAALLEHQWVRAAAVVRQGADLATASLHAFVVAQANDDASEAALRAFLQRRLPGYMLPARITPVESLPRTPNGKIDRLKLRALAEASAGPATGADANGNGAAYHGPVEEQLAAILGRLLGSDRPSRHASFFDVGGTSLLAVRYIARAGEALGVDLSVADLLRHPSVASLAERVEAMRRAAADLPPGLAGDESDESADVAAPMAASEWRPLALLRAAGAIGPIDAAAIAYLPDFLAMQTRMPRQRVVREWFGDRPFWYAVNETPHGRIAVVTLPMFAADLFVDQAETVRQVVRAAELTARIGARAVSLTGLIPAATEYGRAISRSDALPAITTGHATTAAAMVMNIAEAVREAGRDLSQECVAVLGLGSIGVTVLNLMLDRLPHPASLILCDLPAQAAKVRALAAEIRRRGFAGPVEVALASSTGAVPDAVYQASFVIGATNAPDVLDVARLAPGAVIVDDSFPPCFSMASAVERVRRSGDIMFSAGGLVRAPGAIARRLAVPPAALRFLDHPLLLAALGNPHHDQITGCVLSGLLTAGGPKLPPTIGLADLASCRAHYQALAELGFGPVPIHFDLYRPAAAELATFRKSFGRMVEA